MRQLPKSLLLAILGMEQPLPARNINLTDELDRFVGGGENGRCRKR